MREIKDAITFSKWKYSLREWFKVHQRKRILGSRRNILLSEPSRVHKKTVFIFLKQGY